MTDLPGDPRWFAPPAFGEVPVGSIVAFAGVLGASDALTSPPSSASPPASTSPPTTWPLEAWGWTLCDGRQLSTEHYPELFGVLGFLYGGSGAWFALPDYRGYFLRGIDGGSDKDPDVGMRTAAAGGEQAGVGSTQASALQTHVHDYVEVAESLPGGDAANVGAPGPSVPTSVPQQTSGTPSLVVSQSESRPVNIYVNFIIKFTAGLRPNPF